MVRQGVARWWLVAVAAVAALSGCGNENERAPALDASGKHPSGWIVDHRRSYARAPGDCAACHGAGLSGGISGIGCFSPSLDGRACHAGGHGPRTVAHPLPFTAPASHGPSARGDLVSCQTCHGTAGGAGSNPRFNVPVGGITQGCESSGCHLPATAHPVPWSGHAAALNLANACALCHGSSFEGGGGPACSSCHARLAAGTVPTAGTCISCHGRPPSTAVFPNVSGGHRRHDSLAGITGVCAVCHAGGGSGTAAHGDGTVLVAFPAAYNARTDSGGSGQPGIASYDAATGTCLNVSCHGGRRTPSWRGGRLTTATDCQSCHAAGTAQFNGYFSGRHSLHLNPPPTGSIGLVCVDCHDLQKLATVHYSGLGTPQFEGAPATTIRSDVRYQGGSCMPQNSGGNFSIFVCHGVETW